MTTSNFQVPPEMLKAWTVPFTEPTTWQSFLQTHAAQGSDAEGVAPALDPAAMTQLQQDYMQEAAALWQNMLASKPPEIKDKRFASDAWNANAMYAFNAATYLLNAKYMLSMADAVKAQPRVKQKIRFAVQQAVEAMSPANFLATNPEAQQKIIETKGESLAKGVMHMLTDMQKGRISQTDESAFEIGKNVATTEGAVVFENELFQLIQYKPLTKTVYQRPLLIIPPCINKYYILDLQPANSLVRYSLEQGHKTFLVSWKNPDLSLSYITWDDYIESGALKAIELVQEISSEKQINALGFCVGGTILSMALALLAARGQKPVASLSLLTSLLDFSDTGILDVFIDEMQIRKREQDIGQAGLMPGRELAAAFSSLRSKDLIWNYVESNYLKGENPPAFDLLYWNSDSTNLPGPMFCWYLRNLYLENRLKTPGGVVIADEPVDLGQISAPTFIYASREDHIVPWASAYASTRLLNPAKPALNRFVLGASGHIAGVINPPAKKKRSYWTNPKIVPDAEQWLAVAKEHEGSWWPEWAAFLATHGGKEVAAPRKYGNAKHPPIEPAPGRYVMEKA